MRGQLKHVWHDPVWSQVIAGSVLAALGLAWGYRAGLKTNKDWLFVGAAVLAILLIVGFVRWLWRRRNSTLGTAMVQHVEATTAQPTTAPAPPPVRHTRISALTIDEITKPIRDAPPLQRASVAKHSEGIMVQWKAKLASAYPRDGGFVWLVLRFDDFPDQSVGCIIKLSDYPELGVLPKYAPITVTGRISRAERYDVELEDAQLVIHPATS